MAEADDAIRVMLLTGAGGKAFAAATDIAQFRAFKTPEDAIGYEERVSRVIGLLVASASRPSPPRSTTRPWDRSRWSTSRPR